MTRAFTIEKGQKPTEAQMREAEDAKKHPIVFDEDSPELLPAMYKAFKSAVIQRNRRKNAKKTQGTRKKNTCYHLQKLSG